MKVIFLLILFFLASCEKSILNDDDLKLNGEEKISSTILAKDQWKSAFYWHCYPTAQITISTFFSEARNKDFPQLIIKYHDFTMNMTLYSDTEVDADKTISLWKNLFENQKMVCLYLGNLPGEKLYQERTIFFYLERIKTNQGEWSIPI